MLLDERQHWKPTCDSVIGVLVLDIQLFVWLQHNWEEVPDLLLYEMPTPRTDTEGCASELHPGRNPSASAGTMCCLRASYSLASERWLTLGSRPLRYCWAATRTSSFN